jgi:hypothetical protein
MLCAAVQIKVQVLQVLGALEATWSNEAHNGRGQTLGNRSLPELSAHGFRKRRVGHTVGACFGGILETVREGCGDEMMVGMCREECEQET